jgi:hypothetical protein
VAGEQRHAGEALAREPVDAARAHQRGGGEHARRIGRGGVGGRRARAHDAARGVAAQLRQRPGHPRGRLRAGAGQPRRDAVERVPELGRRVVAVAALGPGQDERDHRVQERQRVGGLQQVGFRRAAVLVHAHERVRVAHERRIRALLAEPRGDLVGTAVLVPAVVRRVVPVAGRVPGRVRVGERALDVVGDGGDAQGLGGARVEHVDPLERAHEVPRVRMDVLHPRPGGVDQRGHAAPRSSRAAVRTASAIFT